MKSGKATLFAVIVLIGLVTWLIIISFQKTGELSQAIQRVQQYNPQQPEVIDYEKISNLVEQEVNRQVKSLPKPTNGVDGTDGQNGANGNNGTDGHNGQSGKSAYEIWLDAGNHGTVAEFLASLRGEKGDRGESPVLRLNPTTGVVESKLPTDFFWQAVPTCQESCL